MPVLLGCARCPQSTHVAVDPGEPTIVARDLVEQKHEATCAGRAVALTEVEELRLLLGVPDQVPAARWCGVSFDVAGRSDSDVEIALFASRAMQVGEEVADA